MSKLKQQVGNKSAPPGRLSLWILLTFSFFYLLCSSGHIYTPDGVIMYRVTKSMMDQGSCSIEMLEAIPGFGGTLVTRSDEAEPKFFAKYGLGFSLAAAPSYLAGKALAPHAQDSESSIFFRPLFYNSNSDHFTTAFESFAAGWTNSIVTAAILVLLFLVCLELRCSTKISLLTAAIAGIASPLLHYSKTFFSEPLATLGLVGFLLFAIRGSKKSAPSWTWGLAGLMLSITILTKLFLAILLVPAAVLLIIYSRRQTWRWSWPRLALFAAGVIISIVIIGFYNYLRFSRVLETGYGHEVESWSTPFISGLWGLLASPGRGLLLYCPICLLTLVAWNGFARKFRAESIFIFLCVITLTVGYAKWYSWEGGWCWGPRFLIPVVPLLALPLATLFISTSGRRPQRFQRAALSVVLAIALIVAVNGIVTNYFDFYLDLKTAHKQNPASFLERGFTDFNDVMRWDWTQSPLLTFWSQPHNHYLFITRAFKTPGLILAIYLFFAAGFSFSCYRLWRVVRLQSDP